MIKRAEPADAELLAALAVCLWEDDDRNSLEAEFRTLTGREDAACFLKYDGDTPAAFAQCQLRRDYVEGTDSSPVGYLEGIYVVPAYRKRGYAAELLSACEAWAKQQGCREFASDCELENGESLRFHLAMGFREANRVICFTKEL